WEIRYRGLVVSLPVLVLQADQQRRLTYVNPATRAVTGFGLEEIAEPAAWEGLINPEDRPRVVEVVRDSLAGRAGRVEFRYRAKDGAEKAAYALVQPSRLDGAVAGTTLLLVDMTRERQLERELQRSQRLELIGRLSSGIAHDFNNLLSVVLALTDL